MRALIGTVGLATLVGCTSNTITVRQAAQAHSDQVYAFQSGPAQAYGTVTVVRDNGVNGSGCDSVIYIDGKKAAKISSGEKASFFVSPGSRSIGTGLSGTGFCGGQAIRTVATNVTSNQEVILRISSDLAGYYIGPYVEY